MGGSGGGSSGNQTTRIEPPSYQLPYLQSGLQQAQGLYNKGPSVVPFSPQTEQALQLTQQRALAGSPLTQGAQDYAQKSLSGGFLGSNPYLDATFNKAAMATQGQLASQFGSAGRNVDQSQGLRSQQLNDLATNIYGGAYENERNRQQQVLPQAQGLAQASYDDYGRLAGVGTAVEGLAQDYADAPSKNLDAYLGRVTGNMGQTSVTPTTRNRGAGALGGALSGAQLGSSFGPWGSLLGGIGGGLLGGWG